MFFFCFEPSQEGASMPLQRFTNLQQKCLGQQRGSETYYGGLSDKIKPKWRMADNSTGLGFGLAIELTNQTRNKAATQLAFSTLRIHTTGMQLATCIAIPYATDLTSSRMSHFELLSKSTIYPLRTRPLFYYPVNIFPII